MFSFLLKGSLGDYFAPRPAPKDELKVCVYVLLFSSD
jgi:hypothetical protein